jgi:hypothetical protein
MTMGGKNTALGGLSPKRGEVLQASLSAKSTGLKAGRVEGRGKEVGCRYDVQARRPREVMNVWGATDDDWGAVFSVSVCLGVGGLTNGVVPSSGHNANVCSWKGS